MRHLRYSFLAVGVRLFQSRDRAGRWGFGSDTVAEKPALSSQNVYHMRDKIHPLFPSPSAESAKQLPRCGMDPREDFRMNAGEIPMPPPVMLGGTHPPMVGFGQPMNAFGGMQAMNVFGGPGGNRPPGPFGVFGQPQPPAPMSPLITAIEANDEGRVGELLRFGAPVESQAADGRTALMLAASLGRGPIVEALLNHRAEINAMWNPQPRFNVFMMPPPVPGGAQPPANREVRGATALRLAVAGGFTQVEIFLSISTHLMLYIYV
jgi:hypothetical protein